MRGFIAFILGMGLFLSVSVHANDAPLQVYTAASLQDVVRELCQQYKTQAQVEIWINAAASGVLANQIIHGAPADLFISANQAWIEEVQHLGRIRPQDVSIIATNRLVIATAEARTLNAFEAISMFRRIAIGNPKTVPAGQYAMEVVDNLEMNAVLKEKFIFAKDVRDALRLVTTKTVPAAIVYQSDAQVTRQAQIALIIPEKYHTPIYYWAGLIQRGENQQHAIGLMHFMGDPAADAIWEKHGFEPIRENHPAVKP